LAAAAAPAAEGAQQASSFTRSSLHMNWQQGKEKNHVI
jgi:hypothetical protein